MNDDCTKCIQTKNTHMMHNGISIEFLIIFFLFRFIQGNLQYNERLEDIKFLKIEIKNLRSQRNLLARGSANTADMRQEVLQLNRVLCQERVRSRALESEMTTPMNVHR